MRSYELVFIVDPSVKEDERKKLLTVVKDWLKGVKVVKEEDLGSKALKYKIKGELTGHYFSLKLEAEAFPADFEKRLVEHDKILRHLLIRTK